MKQVRLAKSPELILEKVQVDKDSRDWTKIAIVDDELSVSDVQKDTNLGWKS
jgi:hypothetical protein